jgi:hypothetical protein
MSMCTPADRRLWALSAIEQGGGTAKNEQRAYERDRENPTTCAISESPSVRSAGQKREALPVASDEKGAVPIARRRKR